jgi:beta-N-acetylhexosaminidase
MSASKESRLRGIVENLSIEEKAGQLLVVDFTGITITPHLVNLIDRCHVAGVRVGDDIRVKEVYHSSDAVSNDLIRDRSVRAPTGFCKDLVLEEPAPRCRASEYAATLNRVKSIAMNRRHGIPLHVTLDQENTGRGDFTSGDLRLFPPAMGMAATADEALIERAYRSMARQLKTAGFSMIHSPVVDVNTNPKNPEVGIRSFGDDTAHVAACAAAFVRAFNAEKVISTAKHYPGRGESAVDSHFDLPVIELDREALLARHIAPYRALIAAGLPAVMIAHTVYPALDASGVPATISRRIVADILRTELGHTGIITSDNMLMTGLIKNYEIIDACILGVQAGCTLLLPRVENPLIDEIYASLVAAIRSGQIDRQTVDDAIYTNLAVKYDFGLFEDGGLVDPAAADAYQAAEEHRAVEAEVTRRSVVMLREAPGLLPLSPATRVLLVDQTGPVQRKMNNFACHAGTSWEMLLERSTNVMCVETDCMKKPDEATIARVMRRVPEADVIVATDWEVPRGNKRNHALLARLAACGKPLVVVTNSPFRMDHAAYGTVIVCWTDTHNALRTVAGILYGHERAAGTLPVCVY